MNVSSKELSKKLYELTGWGARHEMDWYIQDSIWDTTMQSDYETGGEEWHAPAYDAGYLLRKLPKKSKVWQMDDGRYVAENSNGIEMWSGDTPENALAKLAIKLKEEGVI